MPERPTIAPNLLALSMRGPSSSSSSSSTSFTSTASPGSQSKAEPKPNSSPSPPSPSASVLLISPTNRILLLHRVTTSRSFASAHVFPGGHVSPEQDGALPPISSPTCHEDSLPYRIAAIRECFEESGLLLARHSQAGRRRNVNNEIKEGQKNNSEEGTLLEIDEQDRETGRRAIHANRVSFQTWVEERGGQIDVEGLIPFTRWLTPADIERRFSTQMYLYFLPLSTTTSSSSSSSSPSNTSSSEKDMMHIPTPDGGIEHTAATFLYPAEWLAQSLKGDIVLFPPQFFLLSLLADFLAPPASSSLSSSSSSSSPSSPPSYQQQRDQLLTFIRTDGTPSWGEKCISPDRIRLGTSSPPSSSSSSSSSRRGGGGMSFIMGLANPGPELEGTGRAGDKERVIRIELDTDGDGDADGEAVKDRGGTGRRRRRQQRPRPRKVVWRRDWERGKL